MPLSRKPGSCEPHWKEYYSWISFIFKIKIVCLSYHSTCFPNVNTCEKSGQNGIVSKFCLQPLGGFKLGFDISDLPFIHVSHFICKEVGKWQMSTVAAVSQLPGNQQPVSLIINSSLSPVSLVFPESRTSAGVLYTLKMLRWTSL